MADMFEILIKFGLSKEKATEAVSELKKLKEVTTEVGKEGVKQEQAVEEATKKTAGAKKQLQEALKGVAAQYPGLAAAARLALNPISLSIAAITTAFVILKTKLTEVAESIGSAKWGTEKVNEAATAWNNYAAGVAAAQDATKTLAANLQKIATFMALIERLGKNKGMPVEANPLADRKAAEAKAAEMEQAAAANRAQADELRRQAKKIDPRHDANYDANLQNMLDKDAADAAGKISALDQEIAGMEEAFSPENRGLGRYTPEHIKYAARYGAMTDPDEMIATLKQQRAEYQNFVDRAATGKTNMETMASRRSAAAAARKRADDLDASAAEMESKAGETRFQGQVSYYAGAKEAGVTPPVTPTGAGWSVTPQVKAYFDKANADLTYISAEWARTVAALKQQTDATAQTVNTRSRKP